MSRDLFDTVTHPPTRVGGRSGVTLSLVTHAVGLAAIVVVPLLATDVLPTPHQAFDTLLLIEPPPELPVPVASAPRSATGPVTTAIPLEAPPSIAAEPADRPPADLGYIARGAVFTGAGGITGDDDRVIGLTPPPSPPVPVAPREPVRVGGTVTAPAKVFDVAPIYPVIARSAGLEGTVILQATIGLDGRVEGLQVLRSAPLLDDAALTAVRQWRYTPTRLNGQPVVVIMTVTVSFRLR
jgi:periplasmic protein TonB